MEKSISSIKQLTCRCKKCDTKVIMKIGSALLACPVCGERFMDLSDRNSLFSKVADCINEHADKPFEIGFVCDDE